MEWYLITESEKQYFKQFKTGTDCRNWCINHLDMSKEINYDRLQYLLENNLIEKIVLTDKGL